MPEWPIIYSSLARAYKLHGPDAGAAGDEAVRCELNGPSIAFFRRLPDGPDLVRGRAGKKEAAHIGHYDRVGRLNLEDEFLS